MYCITQTHTIRISSAYHTNVADSISVIIHSRHPFLPYSPFPFSFEELSLTTPTSVIASCAIGCQNKTNQQNQPLGVISLGLWSTIKSENKTKWFNSTSRECNRMKNPLLLSSTTRHSVVGEPIQLHVKIHFVWTNFSWNAQRCNAAYTIFYFHFEFHIFWLHFHQPESMGNEHMCRQFELTIFFSVFRFFVFLRVRAKMCN